MADHDLTDAMREAIRVKPLVWVECSDGSSHDDGRMYEVTSESKWYKLCRAVTGGGAYLAHYPTLEAAKAAAQADYEARIRSALEPVSVQEAALGVMDTVTQIAARDARDVFSDHKQACEAVDYMEQLIYAALRALADKKE